MNDDLSDFLNQAGSETNSEIRKLVKQSLQFASKNNKLVDFCLNVIACAQCIKTKNRKTIIHAALLMCGINYMTGKKYKLPLKSSSPLD